MGSRCFFYTLTQFKNSWASCVKCPLTGSCVGQCQGYARNWFTQPSNPFSQDQGWDRRPGADVYVIFYWISHSHLFNKIDIQPTYMHKYSSSPSLVPHSLIYMLIQVISHNYVTLEPQIRRLRYSQRSRFEFRSEHQHG